MKLGIVGFFPELAAVGEFGEVSIFSSVRETGEDDENFIVDYLDGGHCIVDVTESVPDVVSGRLHPRSAGGSSLITDGAWVWRQDLAHYVITYHVRMPEEFLSHMRSVGHRVPPLISREFGPKFNEVMPVLGWSSLTPWISELEVIHADRGE